MSNRKGFVFSLIAVLFMMLLILMAATMADEYAENERVEALPVPNSFAAASLDNVGTLAADLLLPNASVTDTDNGTTIWVSDTLPRQVNQTQLSGLQSYAQGQLAYSQHAVITMDTSQVLNNSLSLLMMDDFMFQSTLNNSPTMVFRSLGNGSSTNATSYNITISVADNRSSVSGFTFPGGTLNVTLAYTDNNGTVVTGGSLNPSALNHFSINYASGVRADIYIGMVSQNGSSYNGALMMDLGNDITNETAAYSFSAQLPPQPSSSHDVMVFPVQMTYTQGDVEKTANATR
jgi:hypothetical protein